MAAIDFDVELRRAGANATGGWRRVLFLAQRHVLGAAGLVIMILFVFTAIFADILARFARFLVEAIRWRDYPIVQNLVMLIAVVVVSANFIVDMLYAVFDPRIRFTD